MGTQVQGDCGKNCLSYLWPINVAVLDINTANETKLTFTFYTKSHSLKKGKVNKIFINANNSVSLWGREIKQNVKKQFGHTPTHAHMHMHPQTIR